MTPSELQNMTEEQLRQEVTRVLYPETRWPHDICDGKGQWLAGLRDVPFCLRCQKPEGDDGWTEKCCQPPPATGSMADIAERLRKLLIDANWRQTWDERFEPAVVKFRLQTKGSYTVPSLDYSLLMDARERVICCLLALEGE